MGRDKLWIDLYGRPVWRWSLDALVGAGDVECITVVTPSGTGGRFRELLPVAGLHPPRFLVADGGATRAASVLAGLEALAGSGVPDDAMVLVHDAARPVATPDLVRRVADAGMDGSAVVPALPVRDSLHRRAAAGGEGSWLAEAVERSGLVAAQTPQLAPLGALRSALRGAGADAAGDVGLEGSLSDEAAVLIRAGARVRVVDGESGNHKLTEASDEPLIRAVLRSRAIPVAVPPSLTSGERAGIGFDAHRLVPGRPLRLGGVTFNGEPQGLAGHSDGDVALHAVIDALLGAAGEGDVGRLFPPDERWRDADSADLLRLAVARVRDAGWRPAAIDVTIVAARPPIAPRAIEIAARIAALAELAVDAVSVKGTTSDGLGFAGREGIAAYAVATVTRLRRG